MPRSAESEYSPVQLLVQERIIEQANLYKVDSSLALNIAKCESKLNPLAKNPYSSAEGVYQFLDGTWDHYGKKHWGVMSTRSKLDGADNVELALWVMGNFGTHDWDESKDCWNKKDAP